MNEYTITVIIPTYRPDVKFYKLLDRLKRQTKQPDRVIVMNTEKTLYPSDLTKRPGIEVHHITKAEFDHGGTRDAAARMADTDLLVFMTMDAVPADEKLLEHLTDAFADPMVGAAYARQLPDKDCSPLEVYTRSFNYGEKNQLKTRKELGQLGIKTFFCSNVCAAYRRSLYVELGGFEQHTIFNEDMIFAGKLIQAGYGIAYRADAAVIHSHNYNAITQFHRNFDLGVSQADHPEIFQMAKSETEGMRMVKQTAGWLLHTGRFYLLPKLVLDSGCKFLGYRFGKNYRKLSPAMIRRCTMNKSYWDRQENQSERSENHR